MPTILPLRRALVPVDSAAAERISAPNYDEFQGDREIFQALRERPDNILRITMAHCAVDRPEAILRQDSPEALERAAANLRDLEGGSLTRAVNDVLFVYEIDDPHRPGVRQVGLGGMAATADIRTGERPDGPVIRNEGIREEKAEGRARLVERIGAFIGTVNLVVDDDAGRLHAALLEHADAAPESFRATDQRGCTHRVWLVSDRARVDALRALVANEPRAYVADGNHRSAAAAMLGLEGYLAVFFPAATMGLAPYNRLVEGPRLPRDELLPLLEESFEVQTLAGVEAFQPAVTHEIGLYAEGTWHRLTPRPGSFDPMSAVETVDADIVQRRLFADVLGIADARDGRLTFVGGDRDALYLERRVDAGEFAYAVTLAPVTMDQFIAVCRQGALMPPKSTWFQPKLRMGLVMALLDET
ncbi:MAG TPA: DUF1015 family protein [Longimicrobiales bacterium]|nr:DUF1015 family protein [Longimicrobiales bacterium]